MLLSISGGSDLGLFEINEAANLVAESAHPEANIIFGAVIDDTPGRRGADHSDRRRLRRRSAATPQALSGSRQQGGGAAAAAAAAASKSSAASRSTADASVRDVPGSTGSDDLDVPDFLKQ